MGKRLRVQEKVKEVKEKGEASGILSVWHTFYSGWTGKTLKFEAAGVRI